MRLSVAVLLGLCLTLLLPSAAASQSSAYTYKEIAYPGSSLTLAFGINDRSQIVGVFNGTDGRGHGFLLSKGEFSEFILKDQMDEMGKLEVGEPTFLDLKQTWLYSPS